MSSTSATELEGDAKTMPSAHSRIRELAASQIENYRRQPAELVGHFNREVSALDGYRGRQLLELLQNADDAGVDSTAGCTLLLSLSRQRLLVANTGKAFSPKGLTSLVISDCSPKQLDRNRFIGCKGLGFRSVLTWTERPLILSGHYEVCFDRVRAEQAVRQLANNNPAVFEMVTPFKGATDHWPAAVMRFPDVPSDLDPLVVEARALRERGYDTVIVLPLPEGARGDAIHNEILEQLSGLPTSSLLFCRHLTRVEITGDLTRAWDLVRENHSADRATVVLERDGSAELWNVYRHSGQVTAEAAETSSGSRRDFEVAVAVPDASTVKSDGNLCVFFPTHDRLPCALVMHATLETTDDRNRLVAHKSNREVLAHLAAHVAAILEEQAVPTKPRRALELLAGLEDADPELKTLGFVDALVRECAKRKVFPRLDGTLEPSGLVRQVPHKVWLSQLDREALPEVLDIGPDDVLSGLLSLFQLTWFDPAALKDRLRVYLLTVDHIRAGEVLGRLLADGQLASVGAAGLLIGTDSSLVVDGTCFFTPVEKLPALPTWASNIRFVDEAFQSGLLRGSKATGLRFLASDLSRCGCDVDEYRFDTVARALIDKVEDGVAEDETAKLQRWQQLLRWLFDASSTARQALPLLSIKVPTYSGGLRRATNCYLGPVYPRGQVVCRLYQQFGIDEFAAAPTVCGLDGVALLDAEEFLVAIGVHASPRMEALRVGADYQRFIRTAIDRLDYPRTIRDRSCTNAAEVREWVSSYSVEGLRLPDRWLTLLTEGDAAAVVAYLLSSGAGLLVGDTDPQAKFMATVGTERSMRPDASVPILNPTLFFLRETGWVPSVEGKRRRPSEIMLSNQGVRVLQGVYSRHALDARDILIAARGGREAMDAMLSRLGAVTSLETISGQSLYELLHALPERDPQGKIAHGIYRTLIKSSVSVEDSPHRDRFLRTGRMWGRHASAEGYLPISELRYNANLTITKAIETHIALVDIPMRMNTVLVKQLYGITSLTSEEIQLKLLPDGTEYDTASEDANQHLRLAMPYIYALRLADNLDERGRELNLLKKAVLRVCVRARILATLPEDKSEEILLTQPREGIVIDTALVVIGEYRENSSGSLTFWLRVAELVAQLLGRDEAAEIGGVLRCRTAAEMLEVVRIRLGSAADAKLGEARSRFEDVLGGVDDDVMQPIPPPRLPALIPSTSPVVPALNPPAPSSPSGTETSDTTGASATTTTTFQPVPGPADKAPKRRKLVVTGAGGSGGSRRGPLATELVTFKVVDAFERDAGRFVIPVSHLRGADSFGCDLVSVASEAVRNKAVAEQSITETDIVRHIEVKGRSSRTGEVELTDNEHRAAKRLGSRYWLYRVFVDPSRESHFEVAVLSDPLNSNAVRTVTRFDLVEGSGATWYSLVETLEDAPDA
ncbi:MAG TPA: DUF3883 domain-containing protein [Bryobacteraceae bacterium]|nr:DUF3883 domain-containing protein [Bryobacteraceae bacterium]